MSGGFSYNEQSKWGGVCVRGNKGRQSPINIVASVVKERALTSPILSTACNLIHALCMGLAKICTFASRVYVLQQVHVHWGSKKVEGSEHRIDGYASEAESRDPKLYLHVIGVLADAGKNPRRGPWQQLDPKCVEDYHSSVYIKLRFAM